MLQSNVGSPSASLICSGCDYIRLTAGVGTGSVLLAEAYEHLTLLPLYAEHEEKRFSYQGYSGFKKANISYGAREDGSLLQVSGATAGLLLSGWTWDNVRCTRLDLQNTYVFDEDRPGWASETVDAIVQFQSRTPRRGHPSVGITGYVGQGFTASVGKRTSQVYGRRYDKAREKASDYVLGTWRDETEYHDETATALLRRLTTTGPSQAIITAMVANWLAYRGAPIPYVVTSDAEPPKITTPDTDTEKQLRWLRTSVSGTVADLIRKGYEKEMLDALFSEYINPESKA